MPIRFLHTADWQIGMKARDASRAGEKIREARFAAAEAVVRAADDAAVDALILAGDTFEDANVPTAEIERTVAILEKSRAPVFCLPANHDPLVPQGIYDHGAWKRAHPKITVFRDASPVKVGDAELWPCPLRSRQGFRDPLADIPPARADRREIRIGVAHGSVLGGGGVDPDEFADNFPIDLSAAAPLGLDYLALGHWHRRSSYPIDGVLRAYYSGSHEPTTFYDGGGDPETRSGVCLLVTIDRPGAVPAVQPIKSSILSWRDEQLLLRDDADLDALLQRLHAEPDQRSTTLWKIKLSGTISARGEKLIDAIEDLAAQRFLFAKVERTKNLVAIPDGDRWIDDLLPGVAKNAAISLRTLAAGGDPVARRALALLYAGVGVAR